MPQITIRRTIEQLRQHHKKWAVPLFAMLFFLLLQARVNAYQAGEAFLKIIPCMLLLAVLVGVLTWRMDLQGTLLLAVPAILLMFGLSILSILTIEGRGSSAIDMKKEALQTFLILCAAPVAVLLYPKLRELLNRPIVVMLLPVLTLSLYIATLVFGSKINGATNWIRIGPIQLQPSEFARPLFIISLAAVLNHARLEEKENIRIILCVVFTAICAVLLLLQNELGSMVILALSFIVMMAVYIKSRKKLLLMIGILVLLCTLALLGMYYGAKLFSVQSILEMFGKIFSRFNTWWNFKQYRIDQVDALQGAAYQINAGLKAMAFGGPGGGDPRYFVYVPVAESDLVFPMFTQTFGMITALLMILLFLAFSICGLRTAAETRSYLDQAILFGFATSLFIQFCLQIAGSTALLPLSGNTLPFVSSGGSSLLACSCMAGLLYRQHRQNLKDSGLL